MRQLCCLSSEVSISLETMFAGRCNNKHHLNLLRVETDSVKFVGDVGTVTRSFSSEVISSVHSVLRIAQPSVGVGCVSHGSSGGFAIASLLTDVNV